MLFGENKSIDYSKLICMIHAPPANTCIDLNSKKTHVGSYAVRTQASFRTSHLPSVVQIQKAIQTYQPLITLHGHIHETVSMSGRYIEYIGNTCCYGVGNFWGPKPVVAIIVDTAEPSMGKRVVFPEKAKKGTNEKKKSNKKDS